MAKKKRKKTPQKPIKRKLENIVRKMARKLPLSKCYVNADWKESGMVTIIVTRRVPDTKLLVGSFVVDIYCLGVKNTVIHMIDYTLFEERVLSNFTDNMGLDMIIEAPNLLFNIIYGAVEYAEDLGFSPHKDFNLTEYILPVVEEVEYMDIEFGKDGKPLYVSGPYDDVDAIMATLNKNVGAGNFNFVSQISPDDYLIDELD